MKLQVIISDNDENLKTSDFGTQKDESMTWFEDKLNIKLKGLTNEESLVLVEKRVKHFGKEGIYPFNERTLNEIIKRSEGNPRILLELCRKKAIELSVKEEAEGNDLTKKGIDIHEEQKGDMNTPETTEASAYKINVVNRNVPSIEIGDSDVQKKGKSSYKIQRVDKE
jgi:hypothetical protein